jgi:3-oxoacyl-[acyl-carrier protein] reductase
MKIGLSSKVAIVTGANNPLGIGPAIAKDLASGGAAVFLTYFRVAASDALKKSVSPSYARYLSQQEHSAQTIVQEIESNGGRAAAIEVDLAASNSAETIFERALSLFGAVDVLVNNAATSIVDSFDSNLESPLTDSHGRLVSPVTAETIDAHFAVNTRAVALLMRKFAEEHVKAGKTWGRVINISTDGARAFNGEVSYGASKYAMESYSAAAAKELGRYGITVNLISAGPVQTGWISQKDAEAIGACLPMRRIGTPQDVSDLAIFLASERSDWLTGQCIYLGGGHII